MTTYWELPAAKAELERRIEQMRRDEFARHQTIDERIFDLAVKPRRSAASAWCYVIAAFAALSRSSFAGKLVEAWTPAGRFWRA
jgi:hypothetical protein